MKILALKIHPSIWYLLPAFKRVTRYNWERYFVFEWLFFSFDTFIGYHPDKPIPSEYEGEFIEGDS
jgi:hypothetical protein